jgi:Type I phosphodiesterase / nucleotide pyrophosphatase
MAPRTTPRPFVLFAVLGGLVSLVVGLAGSVILGVTAGLITFGVGFGAAVVVSRNQGEAADGEPEDPSRRRFLLGAGFAGLTLAIVGAPIGWMARKLARPDPRPVQHAMAKGLGSEYMELVRRAYRPGRSGDLQLLLAPFNSSNYANESVSLVPQDPRTSHASVWMYLERIPMVVYGPGIVVPGDSTDRVTLADLAPTTAQLIGAESFPADERQGVPLPLKTTRWFGYEPKPRTPKVVMTFVIDGGGWNVLQQWPDAWPNLKALMGDGANFRNAIHGSFPAVTACAHATIGTGTYPDEHGITGHNIRDAEGVVRKAYGEPGDADPGDIVLPTLSDLWYEETDGDAWVGEIGYQVWHLGMMGFGGRDRADGSKPVGVYWDEETIEDWAPHNPDLYRLPAAMPGREHFDAAYQAFWDAPPDWDEEFTPQGRQAPCCSPPVVAYQGDLIESTLDSEPVGEGDATSLLYTTFKSPDYTGHIYGMASEWERLQLEAVDAELGRVRQMLEDRYPGEFVLIVTADHGQCPLPDSEGGVRLDPIQLDQHISANFSGVTGVVQEVTPHEVYLNTARLWDNGGATVEDVAASLQHYRYRQNLGPYVPADAIEQDLLDREEFAAVFASTYMDSIADADLAPLGDTAYPEGDEMGIPVIP